MLIKKIDKRKEEREEKTYLRLEEKIKEEELKIEEKERKGRWCFYIKGGEEEE
jgi:hypothetical protein